MKGDPITQAEIIEMFGDTIPLQAVQLITDMPTGTTFGEVRHQLRAIAQARSAAPSYGASMLLSLHRRHLQAMRKGDELEQDRLHNLIHEFEWAFPEHAAGLKGVFSGQGSDNQMPGQAVNG